MIGSTDATHGSNPMQYCAASPELPLRSTKVEFITTAKERQTSLNCSASMLHGFKSGGGEMAAKINASVYVNSEDAFVAWAPSDFIPNCWGFQLERKRKVGNATPIDIVENRVGFEKDALKSGDHILISQSAPNSWSPEVRVSSC